MTFAKDASDGAILNVKVVARSSANKIAGVAGDSLKIRVTAPPVDGKANKAVTETVAAALGIPKTAVTVDHGARGKNKKLRISGLNADEAGRRLRPLVS